MNKKLISSPLIKHMKNTDPFCDHKHKMFRNFIKQQTVRLFIVCILKITITINTN